MRSQTQALVRFSQFADALLIAAAIAVTIPHADYGAIGLFLVAVLAVSWSLLLQYFELYQSHRLEGLRGAIRSLISAQMAGTLVLAVGIGALDGNHLWRLWLVKFAGLTTLVLLAERWISYSALHLLRRHGFDARNVLLVGNWEKAAEVAAGFQAHPEWGMRVSGVASGSQGQREFWSYPDRQQFATLEDLLRFGVVDEVLLNVAPDQLAAERPFFDLCMMYGLYGRVLLDMPERPAGPQLENFFGEVTIAVAAQRYSTAKLVGKRAMDLVLATLLLILLSPLMLMVAALVKLSSRGPMLFRQKRTGRHGRTFLMYKFRTMIDGADSLQASLAHQTITRGPVYKNPDDWRITPVGRILRRFSLDELPQLLNVVRGEMSLVGPRPLPVREAQAVSGSHRRRFAMRPGITCLWQVNGRSTVEYSTWMKYDLQYVDGWSFWLDAKLLLQTIPAVLNGRGAY